MNGKPVSINLAKMMQEEIIKNKELFGEDAKYIFVTDKNMPVKRGSFNDAINYVLLRENVLGRDGKPLHVTSHQFRATVATNLVSTGTPVDLAAQMLGQSSLSSLSYYATVTSETTKKQLKPRLEKDDLLIRNIGKVKDMNDIVPKHSVALCNGYCNKSPLSSPCAKANACFNCSMFVPSTQFINSYYLQLQEIETTIAMAQANGYVIMEKKALVDKENLQNIINQLEARKGQ